MSMLSLLPDEQRKDNRKESVASVYSSNSRLNLLNKRKRASPAEMSGKDRMVSQRVLSAKAHRVKQLQNQLADAHYHLQELSNENRILRAVQKKQEAALQRYEGTNAELPTVLNSHSEEMRIQQAKFKQLKKQFQEVQQKLKERDMQLQTLKDEHNHLLELSKDRNLLEREKLQQTVTELSAKVQQQNEQISMLQRRLVLEQKNFRHQLQMEINKHKDTRHDLDAAISNADKLSTIIEIKEKLLSTSVGRNMNTNMRSPPKPTYNSSKAVSKSKSSNDVINSRDKVDERNYRERADERNYKDRVDERNYRERSDERNFRDRVDERNYRDRADERGDRERSGDPIKQFCETSRNLSSVLSYDEEISANTEPKSRFVRSRQNSGTGKQSPNSKKTSKPNDDMIELARTVQDGMAGLIINDEDNAPSPDDMQKNIERMKKDLLNKIQNEPEDTIEINHTDKPNSKPSSRKPSFVRRQSTEEFIEETVEGDDEPFERPKSRGRRNSTVFFYDTSIEETTTTVAINDYRAKDENALAKPKRVGSGSERKLDGNSLDAYCKNIMHGIDKSSKTIDKHMQQFNYCNSQSDKLVEQLAAVDKMNELVNATDISDENLRELNNNFNMLANSALAQAPSRKRAISGRKTRIEAKSVLDDGLSNQDLLDDLLGRK